MPFENIGTQLNVTTDFMIVYNKRFLITQMVQ